jgi:hypothetical protein
MAAAADVIREFAREKGGNSGFNVVAYLARLAIHNLSRREKK